MLNEAATLQAEQTQAALFGRGTFREPTVPGLSMLEVTVSAAALEWTAADVKDAAAEFVARLP